AISAVLTTGNRRVGTPSERGIIRAQCPRSAGWRTSREPVSSRQHVLLTAEGLMELGTGAHAELREDPVEVGADRAVREVQPLPDPTIRQPHRSELRDLELLRGQLRPTLRFAPLRSQAGRSHLSLGPFGPGGSPQSLEDRERRAQEVPRLGDAPSPPEPRA